LYAYSIPRIPYPFVSAKIGEEREELLSHPKNQSRSLDHSVGAKNSNRSPGEGLRDLLKEGIFLCIIQKIFVGQEPLAQTLVQHPEASSVSEKKLKIRM
jgi:hypothetical protein